MSGSAGKADEERAALYVLGALNAEEMRAVRVDAERDIELQADIAEWERRLAPLAELLDPVPPPATLWLSLEARLNRAAGGSSAGEVYQVPAQRAKPRRQRVSNSDLNFWRGLSGGLAVLAAALAVALMVRVTPPAAVKPAMLLAAHPGVGGWLLKLKPNGEVVAVAQGALSRGLDQDYELWVGEDGADRPVPVGVISVTGQTVIRNAPLPSKHKYELLVSLEAKGGSRSGAPTGAVLYQTDWIQP